MINGNDMTDRKIAESAFAIKENDKDLFTAPLTTNGHIQLGAFCDIPKKYYDLIERFSKITGTGAILNTSFNLHGEPNVLTPEDALHTVEHSSLKYLALGEFLLEKKK